MSPIDRSLRFRCDLAALLELSKEGKAQGRVLELSESGAFVETSADLQYDDPVKLGLVLNGSPWFAQGKVVRMGRSQKELHHPTVENVTVSREGVGVRFDRLPARARQQLRAFLAQLDEQ